MEWDSKMPPWELPELEQHAGEANLSSVVGSSGGGRWRHPGLVGGPDCSVDLKLGGWEDSGLTENWKEQRRASTAASSVVLSAAAAAAASSSKRPRAPGNSSQNISCLVDDCKSDLSSCREYHRRHKVCELHSKTPIVMVGGQEQRFCQQCSRFHLLVEFDEVKRSCRKRLDGHNRRRRKPQPEAINTGNLFPTHHGSRFTSYPQNFQSAATDTTWTSAVKTEEALYSLLPSPMHFIDSMPKHFVSTFNQSYKEERQFSFLHDSSNRAHCSRAAVEPGAVCQPLLSSISSAAQNSSNKIMFSDELPPVLDSDCALSLLSSPTQASEINLGLMGQPLLSELHYGGGGSRYSHHPAASSNSYSAMEEEHVGNVMAQDASGTDVHCQSLFHVGDEGASDGASEPLPFSWQ